jgi:hypothetical protein
MTIGASVGGEGIISKLHAMISSIAKEEPAASRL